ncbi:MAG: EamA family transporter, partial [Gammaproteobacteria bacterium]
TREVPSQKCTVPSSCKTEIWLWQAPTAFALACMALAATFATAGQMALTQAFTHNRAATVAPFSYVTVLLGGTVGWCVWGELPDLMSLAGAGFVICGCLAMVLRPKQPDPWRGGAPTTPSR